MTQPHDSGQDARPEEETPTDEVFEPVSPTPEPSSETDSAPEQNDTNDADELAGLKQEVADRTADLQRLQAEYVNYKRRTDRDRDQARNSGVESVIRELLPVLDSVRYAREHDEVTGGFKGVADELDRLASKHGVEAFGAEGDPFDPHIHEALMNAEAEGITVATCVTILQPGYKVNDRVVRPARVAVAEPQDTSTGGDDAGIAAVSESVSDSVADQNMAPDGAGDVVGTPGERVSDAEAERHDDDGTAGQ